MPYPEELKNLIKVVEQTRAERVERKKKGEEIPFLSLSGRKDILQHHPDVNEESRREIRVGPSKGYAIPHEIVDLLEARARVSTKLIDLSSPAIETDVLVIGGGGAGTSAALIAQKAGLKVTIWNLHWFPGHKPGGRPNGGSRKTHSGRRPSREVD
jgi:NADPH-dependent 2,4-dienoyl-CoA reductase/sulfur reductase-like enzyme